MLGDLPGPVVDVGVEHCPDPRPVAGERQLPVGLDLFRDPDQTGVRLGVQGPQPGAETPLVVPQVVKVLTYAGDGSGKDPGQLLH